jgi:hypothetical protein
LLIPGHSTLLPGPLLLHAQRTGSRRRRGAHRLARVDPAVAEHIDDLPRIVTIRNVLIHGYATIDAAIVWEVATERLAPLIELLTGLLDEQ